MESGAAKGIAKAKANKAPSLIKPQSTITVYVSENDEEETNEQEVEDGPKFIVHRDLICFHSTYFSKAVILPYRLPTVLSIYDTTSSIFDLVVFWLYHQSLDPDKPTKKYLRGEGGLGFTTLSKIWLFAQQYQITALQNTVVQKILTMQDQQGLNGIGCALFWAYLKKNCEPLKAALIARATSLPDLSHRAPIIPKDAWEDMYSLLHKKNRDHRAGKPFQAPQASDFYVYVPE